MEELNKHQMFYACGAVLVTTAKICAVVWLSSAAEVQSVG